MKTKFFKKGLSFLSALVLMLTLMPLSIFATGTNTAAPTVNKTAEWINFEEKIAEITLQVTAADQVASNIKTSDIVFAIDVSGSMKDDIGKVKTAMTGFVNKVLNDETKSNVQIGIVKFDQSASNSSTAAHPRELVFTNEPIVGENTPHSENAVERAEPS